MTNIPIGNWVYSITHQFIFPIHKRPGKCISQIFSLLGGYYTFCELEEIVFRTQHIANMAREYKSLFFIIVAILTLINCRQKLEHTGYLGTKDTTISLKLADLLRIKGSAIVIPTNTTFDTTMDGSFISEKSIQGQFQTKFYGVDFSELDRDIKISLSENYPNCFEILGDREKTNKERYEIGTVARITKQGQHYYFLAVADVNKTGKAENVTMENMTKALVGLWEYLTNVGYAESITVPVIGTGRAGLSDGTFEGVVRETIFSFAAKSQEEFVAKKMTVCIYPTTLEEANVTWGNLCTYLDWQCYSFVENQKRIKSARTIGSPVDCDNK